jgi:hypothetical protein
MVNISYDNSLHSKLILQPRFFGVLFKFCFKYSEFMYEPTGVLPLVRG